MTGYLKDRESAEFSVSAIAGKLKVHNPFLLEERVSFSFPAVCVGVIPSKAATLVNVLIFVRGRDEFNRRVLSQRVDAISLFWLTA